MQLKLSELEQIKKVVDRAPSFDIEKLRENTIRDPKWIAFGSGNIFRAYIARICQDLVEKGEFDRGINVVETRDPETIEKTYQPNDNLAISVTLKSNEEMETELIATVAEAIVMQENRERMYEIFENENLQIVSYTITEKGYDIYDNSGNVRESIIKDVENDPFESDHLMVNSVGFLHARFKKKLPITMLSIDNLSKNGDVLKKSILTIAEIYVQNGRFEESFLDYLNDEKMVTFPWSMIDKITPGPDAKVKDYLTQLAFEDLGPYMREGKAPIAKFVNSEEAEYLAIEDNFANGRPDFSKVGVYLVDKEVVDKIETMKVTACLNPLHTALAVYGCMLGYDRIHQEMKDPQLVVMIKKLAYDEALPVVENPGGINPQDFAKEVIEVRFPNPFMPDAPQRIATDTSMKIPVRYGKTLNTYVERGMVVSKLTYIPLAIAGWLRYLLGVNDKGEKFELSPDPNLEELQAKLEGVELGKFQVTEGLRDLLRNEKIFAIDLEKIGLADKIISMFGELTKGPGAVRETLIKYTK